MDPAHILYVEDDDDIRDTMAMLLVHQGYRVTAIPSAESALDALKRARFDLLLTDYQLPGNDAAWLIAAANAQGCLGDTPVIVLSGATNPQGVEGHRLLRKPVGQEQLFEAFEAAMPARARAAPSPTGTDAELRLVLYVSGVSYASRQAQRNLMNALRDVDMTRVELVVHDLTANDRSWERAAEDDRIVVLPTLVRRSPLPMVWIAGDLSDVAVVREAIVPLSLR